MHEYSCGYSGPPPKWKRALLGAIISFGILGLMILLIWLSIAHVIVLAYAGVISVAILILCVIVWAGWDIAGAWLR